jgi:magnesium transporter
MIRYCDLENGCLVETDDPSRDGQSAAIVLCFAPTPEERGDLSERFGLSGHNLHSSLDPEELARVDYSDNITAVLGKRSRAVPVTDNNPYEAMTFGCFLSKTLMVIVSDEPIPFADFELPSSEASDFRDIVLALLYHATQCFHRQFVFIKELASDIGDRLAVSQNDRLLLDLFNLQKNLTYYQNAVNYNKILVERMQKDAERVALTPRQRDFLDDLVVDADQCCKQSGVIMTILKNMTEAMGSLVNNKLTAIMKRLAIISLIFLPINALASIGGMSEYTTFTEPYMPITVENSRIFNAMRA